MSTQFEKLLEKIRTYRYRYEPGQLKISVPPVITLILSGVMDSLFEKELTLEERFEAIEQFRKAVDSKAKLLEGKKGEIGPAEIEDSFTHNLWLSKVNPIHRFDLTSYFSSAMKIMGFKETGDLYRKYKKEEFIAEESQKSPLDVYASFDSLLRPRNIAFYSSPKHNKEGRIPGIVAIYQGYETKTFTDRNGEKREFRKITLNDGSKEFEATLWPDYHTQDYDKSILECLSSNRRKPCLIFGKISQNRGYNSFSILKMIALS